MFLLPTGYLVYHRAPKGSLAGGGYGWASKFDIFSREEMQRLAKQKSEKYFIFYSPSNSTKGDALWLDCAEGLENATQKMLQIAATKPGKFFVTSGGSKDVVAQIDTSGQQPQARGQKRYLE